MINTLIAIRTHTRNTLIRPMMQYILLIEPVISFYLLSLVFSTNGSNNLPFVLAGSIMFSTWGIISFSNVGDLERERAYGTLEMLFVVPVRFWKIVLDKMLGSLLLSIIPLLLDILFVKYFYRERVHVTIATTITAFAVSCFALIGFSMCLAAVYSRFRAIRGMVGIIDLPIVYFSGFYFGICNIHFPFSIISSFLPTTTVMQIYYDIFSGASTLRPELYWECFLKGSFYFLSSIFIYQYLEYKVKQIGDMSL